MQTGNGLIIITSALALATACGPTAKVPSEGDEDSGDEAPKTDVGSSSTSAFESTGEQATSTGPVVTGCGNGVIEDDEWCYEQHILDDVLPEADELFRVHRGETVTADVFAFWSLLGFHSIAFDEQSQPPFLLQQFYESPGGYNPGSRLFAARFSSREHYGQDFFHWEPELTNVGAPSSAMQAFWLVPGPDRADEPSGASLRLLELIQSRDAFLIPIDVDSNGNDEFFAIDPTSGLAGLYFYNPSTTEPPSPDWKPFEGAGTALGLRQSLDAISPCILRSATGGDLNDDGFDEAVIVADTCPIAADDGVEFIVFRSDGRGMFEPKPDVISLFSPGPIKSLQLADVDGDNLPDIVFAGDGFLHALVNDGNGAFEVPTPLVGVPESFFDNQFNESPFLEEETVLPLGSGHFSGSEAEDVVFPTGDGVSIASLGRENVVEFPGVGALFDFAVADINNDGLDDVAILHEQDLVIWLSSP